MCRWRSRRLFVDKRFVGAVPPRTASGTSRVSWRRSRHGWRAGRRPVGVPRPHAAVHLHGARALGGARRAVEVADALGADELAARALGRRGAGGRDPRDALLGRLESVRRRASRRASRSSTRSTCSPFTEASSPTTRARRHTSTRSATRSRSTAATGCYAAYTTRDDFGHMEAAFLVCTFWLVEALRSSTARKRPATSERLRRCRTASASTPGPPPGSIEQTVNFPRRSRTSA